MSRRNVLVVLGGAAVSAAVARATVIRGPSSPERRPPARSGPPSAGTFLLHFDFIHWATQKVLFTRSIPLNAR